MLNQFKAPFPFFKSQKSKWIASFSVALFVYLFLLIFQPFELHQVNNHKALFIGGYGIITFFVMTLVLVIFPILMPKIYNRDHWNVGKTILLISLQLLCISTLNWLYTNYASTSLNNSVMHSFFYFLFITISVGIFPCIFLVLFLERKLRKEKEGKATSINDKIINETISPKEPSLILYKIGTEKQYILTKSEEFLCIKTEGNYLEIYQWKDNKMIKNVIRLTLKEAKNILQNEKDIQHCHRSYLVNFNYLEKVTGNARNYGIQLSNIPFSIPISRSFSKDLIKKYL